MNIITERLYDETWLAYDEDAWPLDDGVAETLGDHDAPEIQLGWGKTQEEVEADLRHQMEGVA